MEASLTILDSRLFTVYFYARLRIRAPALSGSWTFRLSSYQILDSTKPISRWFVNELNRCRLILGDLHGDLSESICIGSRALSDPLVKLDEVAAFSRNRERLRMILHVLRVIRGSMS